MEEWGCRVKVTDLEGLDRQEVTNSMGMMEPKIYFQSKLKKITSSKTDKQIKSNMETSNPRTILPSVDSREQGLLKIVIIIWVLLLPKINNTVVTWLTKDRIHIQSEM